MLRIFDNPGGRPQVLLRDVTTAEELAVESAIEILRCSTKHGVDGIADLLLQDFRARCISTDSIERLSKWANSDFTYASAVDPARSVVRILLACPLMRLIDEHGKRVSDYEVIVNALGRQIA